jgi:hypothetical protein
MKIDLVLRPNEFTSFTSFYLEEFWRRYFNISLYDSQKTYDKNRTLFAVWWMNVDTDPWVKDMQSQGYKIVVDNLWERRTYRDDFYWIEHKYSMGWNESLWWEALGYSTYYPQKNLEYIALLQLRLQKPERDCIVDSFDALLPKILWSYLSRGKLLPNDADMNDPSVQRYMHESWYNTTYCSVVTESFQHGDIHISEKSYKPLAYYHPFMVLGCPGTLQSLKEAGFETFNNLFDESYDTIDNFESRLKIVKSNLENIDLKDYDKLTLDKLEHNHNHFFNKARTLELIEKEIIIPLIEYAET